MSKRPVPESPLDPFMARFLGAISEGETGYLSGTDNKTLAESLEMQCAFLDMLFNSARTRGLLKPAYGRGSKIVWNVSPTGQDLIAKQAEINPVGSSAEHPDPEDAVVR